MSTSPSQQLLSEQAQTETIEIQEFDQAKNLVATYFKTSAEAPEDGYTHEYFYTDFLDETSERVDVQIEKQPRSAYGYGRSLLGAFLPVGYPESVSEDYLEYQIYDSLQAFSSSIAGMLSSRAVLEGIGVGSTHTTPTNALLLSILQESLGRIATILFASRLGPALEAECKFYRLAADVFNDCAMLLDCLSPAFPTAQRVILLSGSSVLRALCGIAAGSSKASLSLHFAKNGNVADLAAKDSSQETVISLLGMLVGSVVITHINTKTTTWFTLVLLLSIHLYTNYRAVRAVCLNTLNQQRANILFSTLVSGIENPDPPSHSPRQAARKAAPPSRLPRGIDVLKPHEVRQLERILQLRHSVLRWTDGKILGACYLGVPLSAIMAVLPKSSQHNTTGTYRSPSPVLTLLLAISQDQNHILYLDQSSLRPKILIALKNHSQVTYLQAWFHAFLLVRYLHADSKSLRTRLDQDFQKHEWKYGDHIPAGKEVSQAKRLQRAVWVTGRYMVRQWGNLIPYLEDAGWDLKANAMMIRSDARRFRVRQPGDKRDEGEGESDESG